MGLRSKGLTLIWACGENGEHVEHLGALWSDSPSVGEYTG